MGIEGVTSHAGHFARSDDGETARLQVDTDLEDRGLG